MSQSSDVPVEAPLAPPTVTQFRIVHMMYVMAMLGISLALFGPWGTWPALIVLTFWGTVWYSKISRPDAMGSIFCVFALFIAMMFLVLSSPPSYSFLGWALLFFFVCTLAFLLYSQCNKLFSISFLIFLWLGTGALIASSTGAREAARRMQCTNNLKQIGLALHNYHDIHGSFPPPYLADADGTPMHSWRVLILPFIEEVARYKKYDFDEPWNGPNNIKLLDPMPDVYRCPSIHHDKQHENCTCYLAVVGPDCIWSEEQTRTFADIVDGSSNTALLTEFGESETLWLEPSDMEYQAALNILGSNDPDVFKEIHPNGRNVLMGDGSVRFTQSGFVPEFWSAMLSINDPEFVGFDSFERQPILERPNPWPFATSMQPIIFVVLLFLPLPWVWIKPKVVSSSDDPVDLEST
ncbi:MAG: hypothetical protein COA78_02235 [Blastopirellula sp.]|nr:MAG: hypothetical protein COA78_02235 [Blastopirellula sp.]